MVDEDNRWIPACCGGEAPHIHCVECDNEFYDYGNYVDFEDPQSGAGLCRGCFSGLYIRSGWFLEEWEITFAAGEQSVLRNLDSSMPRRKTVPLGLRARIFRRDGYRCLVCHSSENLTIDHIVSVKAGGLSVQDNLQTLCRSCNISKSTGCVDLRDLRDE
jgi:hypothetical protein